MTRRAFGDWAARWHVSKQQAVLRAIREADSDIYAISDERADTYAEALERLGTE